MSDVAHDTMDLSSRVGVVERDITQMQGSLARLERGFEKGFSGITDQLSMIAKDREQGLKTQIDRQQATRPTWMALVASAGSACGIMAMIGALVVFSIDSRMTPLNRDIAGLFNSDVRFSSIISDTSREVALMQQRLSGVDSQLAEAAGFRKWYFLEKNIPGENGRRDSELNELTRRVQRIESGSDAKAK